ncbi:MAG: hypothetical protein ABJB74_20140 [Gemmatimonas sp.]
MQTLLIAATGFGRAGRALRAATVCLVMEVLAVITLTPTLHAQAPDVPVRRLADASRSVVLFAFRSVSIAELPDGRVLAHDRSGRRLLLFDSTLRKAIVISDSAGTGSVPYPVNGFANPLIPYRGDTTLLIDYSIPAFVAIDSKGNISATISHPKSTDLLSPSIPNAGAAAFDNRGRFIYRAMDGRPPLKPGDPPITAGRDTIAIVRVDLDKRTIDTIAHYGITRLPGMTLTTDPATGKQSATVVFNPFPHGPDDWTVLSTGTLGIVRAHDYHVDWIHADGTSASSEKLPYDWKRVTDEEKQSKIDSRRNAESRSRWQPLDSSNDVCARAGRPAVRHSERAAWND